MSDAPKKIWLYPEYHLHTNWVGWRLFMGPRLEATGHGVRYIRADIAEAEKAELEAALAKMTAQKAELVEALRLALKLADEMQVFCNLHGLGPSGEWAGVSDTLSKFMGVKDANG